MWSKVLKFLIGAVYLHAQVLAAEEVYIAELLVESNITLNANTILSALNTLTDFQVTDADGATHRVTVTQNKLVAECQIVGDQFTCSCSDGYTWSNEVCYNHSCCRETACNQNVSHIVPLCVAQVSVHISGSVTLNNTTWDSTKTDQLVTAFADLNGFQSLNVTGQRQGNSIADFQADVSVRFQTSKLQSIVTRLETELSAVLQVITAGMVTIESTGTAVCYQSSPVLKCSFEEVTGSAGWNMSNTYRRFELNQGSVVKMDHSCSTGEFKSCVAVTLNGVTGIWAGEYECGFTLGSIRHTAKTHLSVVLLPDKISLEISPLTADCSMSPESVNIAVTAKILNSTESFVVWWSYMGVLRSYLTNNTDGDLVLYSFTVPLSCKETTSAQSVSVTFKNRLNQIKSEKVDIPVIYAGAKFCSEEELNGEMWPKSPDGDTVIRPTCPEGRVGYKSRTCRDATWQPVYSECVNQELKKVLNNADNFLMGLGASQSMAMDIFEGLKNSSMSDNNSIDTIADISASIDVLEVMARASENFAMEENVFPDFADAASNMVNKTWAGVNESIMHSMSSTYLQAVEGLVKNIKVNTSNGLDRQNLQLKFCFDSNCSVSVFDIGVNLNKATGMMKTVAVKNLMDKLQNNFDSTVPTSLLISVTLVQRNGSSVDIRLDFPTENPNKPICVFWNTTAKGWSDVGCIVKSTDGNHTRCKCNHLTSFSVLMSKSDISDGVLDIITNVGLGVSICSLLIFLVIESLVWSAVVKTNLSHFRHTALVNIAVFLLLADCSFLASSSPKTLSEDWCLIWTVCKHLFFLAMFSWMLCMSVMLIHQLIFVFSPLRKRVFMFLSSITGYVCPILIVGSSYVYCKYTNKPYYDKVTCWLVFERLLEGSLHAFVIPVGTVVLTNIFSMLVVIVTLMKSSDGNKTDDKETAKSILKVVVFLTPVFGVTWIIGFAQLMLSDSSPVRVVAAYSFTILNSFQGFLLLLTGCFSEQKVREELLKLIKAKCKGKGESMKNSTSTVYTKDK